MSRIKVKNEISPNRCEVCHQTDYFDAQMNHCSRCNSIIQDLTSNKNLALDNEVNHKPSAGLKKQKYKGKEKLISKLLLSFSLAMCSTFITILSGFILIMYSLPIETGKVFYSEGLIRLLMIFYIDFMYVLFGSIFRTVGIGPLESNVYIFTLSFTFMIYCWWCVKASKSRIAI